MKVNLLKSASKLVLVVVLSFITSLSYSSESSDKSTNTEKIKYKATETTMHHLLDSYDWEFYKKSDGHYAAIHLPRIFWNPIEGKLDFFKSTSKAKEAGYIDLHEFFANSNFHSKAKHGALIVPQALNELNSAKQLFENADSETEKADAKKSLEETLSKYAPLDFSITKNVLFIFFCSILLLLIFISIAKSYIRNAGMAPKGMQSFFEPIIIFIRDDVAKANIPHHYDKFMPFLLTVFFFIWFLNLLGLMPFSGNVTGNISVTCGLALITFFITNINGKKTYWQHIFWMPDAPTALKPLMLIVEVISLFAKPFALMIRLFANITAGHVIILSFIGLIFVIGNMGENPVAAWGTSIFSTAFILFIYALELFVAILQAYIFTVLSAIYIGSALEEGH